MCFGLNFDSGRKPGQIAHVDRNRENNRPGNLVFLCLDHHNEYDSRTSQAKGISRKEIKHHRDSLYDYVEKAEGAIWTEESGKPTDRTADDSMRVSLEVYDRRIVIYRAVRDFLERIIREAAVSVDDLHQFASDTEEALFLFDWEVSDRIREIHKHAVRLHYTEGRLSSPRPADEKVWSKLVDQNSEELNWLSDQYVECRALFKKYLGL